MRAWATILLLLLFSVNDKLNANLCEDLSRLVSFTINGAVKVVIRDSIGVDQKRLNEIKATVQRVVDLGLLTPSQIIIEITKISEIETDIYANRPNYVTISGEKLNDPQLATSLVHELGHIIFTANVPLSPLADLDQRLNEGNVNKYFHRDFEELLRQRKAGTISKETFNERRSKLESEQKAALRLESINKEELKKLAFKKLGLYDYSYYKYTNRAGYIRESAEEAFADLLASTVQGDPDAMFKALQKPGYLNVEDRRNSHIQEPPRDEKDANEIDGLDPHIVLAHARSRLWQDSFQSHEQKRRIVMLRVILKASSAWIRDTESEPFNETTPRFNPMDWNRRLLNLFRQENGKAD